MARIVIADDNKELVNMISEFLKMQSNIEVVKTFTGGKNLLTYLETNMCDILLLDIFMPEMDGVNILTEINNNKKYMTHTSKQAWDHGGNTSFSFLELILKVAKDKMW